MYCLCFFDPNGIMAKWFGICAFEIQFDYRALTYSDNFELWELGFQILPNLEWIAIWLWMQATQPNE